MLFHNANIITNERLQVELAKLIFAANPFIFISCYLAMIELPKKKLSMIRWLYFALNKGKFGTQLQENAFLTLFPRHIDTT